MNGTDMRGNVFISFEVKSIHGSNMENNAKICQKYCCREPRCAAWVMRKQNAATANCPKGLLEYILFVNKIFHISFSNFSTTIASFSSFQITGTFVVFLYICTYNLSKFYFDTRKKARNGHKPPLLSIITVHKLITFKGTCAKMCSAFQSTLTRRREFKNLVFIPRSLRIL